MTTMTQLPDSQILEAVQKLTNHPDYRILRRFTSREAYGTAPEGIHLSKGIILDTETTGTNPEVDKLIELGMIQFEYDAATGQAYRILETYNALEDPGMPIPEAASKVNGITDDMVKGMSIDEERIQDLVLDADIIIAHNASFDRPVMERRMPIFASKAWGCSRMQVDWNAEGIGSHKLDYLAYCFGFFYDAHRAEIDCRALLELLQQTLPVSQVTPLKAILDKYREAEHNVAALASPFEAKDVLKTRGYRWNGNDKYWHTSVTEADLDMELDWLRGAVYRGKSFRAGLQRIDAFNRFSSRKGEMESRYA